MHLLKMKLQQQGRPPVFSSIQFKISDLASKTRGGPLDDKVFRPVNRS